MRILLLKIFEQKKSHIRRVEMPEIMKDPYLWAALDLGWKWKHKGIGPLWYLSTRNVKRILNVSEDEADEQERKLKGEKI